MPVTLIHDISRGRLANLRYERDIASMDYDICKEYMRNIRINQESMRTLVSFDKEHLCGIISKVSVATGAAAICLFAAAREPYVTILLFLFFAVKIFLLLQQSRTK